MRLPQGAQRQPGVIDPNAWQLDAETGGQAGKRREPGRGPVR